LRRLGPPSEGLKGHAMIEMKGGDVGPESEGPADVLPGEVRLAALGGEDAEQVPSVGVGG
jgi:hypothetical protein